MSYEQSDRLDRNSSDRNSNAGVAGIARDAYDPSSSKWHWNLNTQDTASGALPSLTLTNGSSGESASMQNAAWPGQNSASQGEGSWMQNAAWPGQNSASQGEGSWMQNAASAEQNSTSLLSGTTSDAGMANSVGTQSADSQSGNQSSLPAELQQLESGIQQQLQQLAQEVSQLQAELGIPSQTAGDVPATTLTQSAASPVESTPVASTSPQSVPTEVTPVASTLPQSNAPATDATIQALQTTDPQAAQLLTAMEPATSGMTQAGFSQFENTFNQNIQGGQYPDVASAANAATAQLQNSGDATDAGIATNLINSNINAGNDAALSTYNTANDPTIQAFLATNPQAAQLLTQMQPSQSGMSAAAYSQFENSFNQNVQGGQYADVQSAANAAAMQLQNSGDTADSTISTNVINANIAANGDAALSTYAAQATVPPSEGDTPIPIATPTDIAPSTTTAANGTSVSTADTPGAVGTYHVEGDQIIGPNGKPFIMAGINDTEMTEHDELAGDFPTLASEGANTVRLMGTAADLENPNDAFNQEVQSALNAGLFVDITDSSDESEYGNTGAIYSAADVSEAAQALQTSAAMYANNPNVGFDVANEQGASGDATNQQLLSNTETLLAAVNAGAQSVNPNADPIKFVDDSEWGQGAFDPNYQGQSFLYNNATALESYGNVVGAVHDYESSSGQYNTAGINAIQQEGMPVIAEEVGVQDPTVAADSFNTLSQTQSTTGEPVGGLVWIDGTAPDGTFYNNVMNTSEAPAVENFWQTIDSEAASATPVSS